MLVEKQFKKDDIITLKLTPSTEELVAKYVSETDDYYVIAKPAMVTPQGEGLGLMQYMFTADGDAEFKLSKQRVLMSAPTEPNFKSHYIQMTTGIATAPKNSSIITS
jgi:hypothetical protein